MGIIDRQPAEPSAVQQLRELRSVAVDLQARISQLADRVESFTEADFDRVHVPADLRPSPGRALENQALDHLQVVIDHAGVATAETLHEQLAAGRQRFYELAAGGQFDPELNARMRLLRTMDENDRLGVYAPFRQYADTHLEDAELRVTAMKEIAGELAGLLSALDSEEPAER